MKKLIAMLTLLCMLAGAVSAAALDFPVVYEDGYTLGDVNGDESVDGKDALSLKATVAGLEGYTVITDAADFDGDGDCTAKDSYSLKTVLSGTKSAEDYDNGRPIFRLTLCGADISDFCIVLGSDTDKNDNSHYAAEELRTYIREACGATLEICAGEENATSDRRIYITQYEYASAEGERFGREGYEIKTEGGNMLIAGTDRGTMYAVYDILREYLGIRFSTTDYVFIYKNRTVDIPEGIDRFFVPRLNFRFTRNNSLSSSTALYHFFPEKLNGSQISMYEESTRYGRLVGPYIANAHSMSTLYQMGSGTMPEDDGTTHLYERYQAKLKSGMNKNENNTWQPCRFGDYKIIFEGLRDHIASRLARADWVGREPDISFDGQRMASFSIEDNQAYCTCRNCRKFAVTQKESYSGLYLDMANAAVNDIQEYYPGTKLYMILYDHTIPNTVRPDGRIVLMYCGNGCNNHYLGSGDCGDGLSYLNSSNKHDEEALPKWGEICRETGAELWWWSYCTIINYSVTYCPNIYNIYYDVKYLVDECNVTGIYCEGGGNDYNFEDLKYHLFSWMMYDPDVSFEDFLSEMKDFLYLYYGDGYEELSLYIAMMEEAGNATGCFINNHNRPGDMYSYDYISANYEDMRALLLSALEKAEGDTYRERIRRLIAGCDFLGLSASHAQMYKNGTEETRAVYCERYTAMYNYIKDNSLEIWYGGGVYELPNDISFEKTPITQFYGRGSWTESKWSDDADIPYKEYTGGYQSGT